MRKSLVVALLLATAGSRMGAAPPSADDPAGVEFFEKKIRPLLVENCIGCHGPDKQKGGLRLDSPSAMTRGGDRGKAIIPSDPEHTLLLRAVQYSDEHLKMPPRGRLNDEQIADLTAWVKRGAPMPPDRSDALAQSPEPRFDLSERRKHWAYQSVRSGSPPAVQDAGWCSSPLDRFILAKLEAAGLRPAPPADKRTLLRRVTFDLTGLPPTPAEVEAFLADTSPQAFARVVDRLLASPAYGERWARHWLDLVRFSETMGYEFDYDVHNAWRYRDYVIRAFNSDLPYDQFVIEHLAGDLLMSPRRNPADGANESILATGFFLLGEGKQTPVDIRQDQTDRIDGQLDVLGKSFLAQTIACARCHDHKFDAVSIRDYYALSGVLKSSRPQQAFIDPPERIIERASKLEALRTEAMPLVRGELALTWRKEIAQTARYLLASREASGNVEAVARAARLDPTRLQSWVEALKASGNSPTHPLSAWVTLTEPTDGPFSDRLARLAGTMRKRAEAASRAGEVVFEDFQRPTFAGWFATGDAFGRGPAPVGEVVFGDQPNRPVARLTRGGADSIRLAARLQGELRSQTFTLDKPFIHIRLAGRDSRVNLILDGYTLIMNPIYGGLTVLPGEQPAWRTIDVGRWRGHRAYVEISDSSIPPHTLSPPPSDGKMPQGPVDGYLTVFEIRCSDHAAPPLELPARSNLDIIRRTPEGIDALALAYQELALEALDRWIVGKASAGETELLDWMLRSGLLDAAPPPGRLADLLGEYRRLAAEIPTPSRAPALADGTGEDEHVLIRGNHRTPGDRVVRGLPEVIAGRPPLSLGSGSGRLELARRLVRPDNPLVARVMVNRLWQHHFGEGIVRTPDDFGRMGQLPSHSELLDYLAGEFVRHGWSIKAMHRMLLLSSAYRMTSRPDLAAGRLDPENRLLHRMPVRRLEAEAIRDAMLAVSGRLERTMYGPGVSPYLYPFMEGRGRPKPGPLDGDGRRSIYLNSRRNYLSPLLLAFDYPASFSTVGRRPVSAVPTQSLALMNDSFVVDQSHRWAERIVAPTGRTPAERIEELYLTAYARPPTTQEREDALRFLAEQSRRHGVSADDVRVWSDLCHVLFNVKEFIFVS